MNKQQLSEHLPQIIDVWVNHVVGISSVADDSNRLPVTAHRKWMEAFLNLLLDYIEDQRRRMVFEYLETQVKRGAFVSAPISEIIESVFELDRILDEVVQEEQDTDNVSPLLSRIRSTLAECAVKACQYYDERVKAQQIRTEELIEEANLINIFLDERGRVTRINRRGAEILNVEVGGVINKNLGQFIAPDQLSRFTEKMGYLQQGIPQMAELKTIFGGTTRIIHITLQPTFSSGKISGARGIATDITEGKQLQAKLRRSEEKYRKLIENANDAIILTDLKEGVIVEANLRACEFVEADKDWLVGRNIMDLFAQDDETRIIQFLQNTIFDGSSTTDNLKIRRRSGGEIFVETSSNVIEYGETRAIQSILRDISERKKLEQKVVERTRELRQAYEELQHYQEDLVQSERIASVSDLSAKLTSQLNDPLQQAESDLIRLVEEIGEDIDDVQTVRSQLIMVRHTLNQVRKLMKSLLSGPEEPEEQSQLDVNSVIDENIKLLGYQLIGRTQLRRELEQVPFIVASRSIVDQVVFSILRNGVSQTPEGGRLLIRTYTSEEYVVIEVVDSGEGIPEDKIPSVLEPALDQADGSLPNYAFARRLVIEHRGQFFIDSKLGYGTLVRVRWPTGSTGLHIDHPLLVLDKDRGEE